MDIRARIGASVVIVLIASAAATAASASAITLQCDNGTVITVDFDRSSVAVAESWGLNKSFPAAISAGSIKFTEEWDRPVNRAPRGTMEHVAIDVSIDRQSGVLTSVGSNPTVCHPAKNAF
jgi:hypothetical protein